MGRQKSIPFGVRDLAIIEYTQIINTKYKDRYALSGSLGMWAKKYGVQSKSIAKNQFKILRGLI